jgi:hypothetical protein
MARKGSNKNTQRKSRYVVKVKVPTMTSQPMTYKQAQQLKKQTKNQMSDAKVEVKKVS